MSSSKTLRNPIVFFIVFALSLPGYKYKFHVSIWNKYHKSLESAGVTRNERIFTVAYVMLAWVSVCVRLKLFFFHASIAILVVFAKSKWKCLHNACRVRQTVRTRQQAASSSNTNSSSATWTPMTSPQWKWKWNWTETEKLKKVRILNFNGGNQQYCFISPTRRHWALDEPTTKANRQANDRERTRIPERMPHIL